MYTKKQRQELEELSFLLLGEKSSWNRFAKQRILSGYKERREPRMVEVNKSITGGRGTLMRMDTAIAKGMVSPVDKNGVLIETFLMEKTPTYRQPSYDELKTALQSQLELKMFSRLSSSADVNYFAALLYSKGELMNIPFLVCEGEQGISDFEVMKAMIPEDLQVGLSDRIVPKGNEKEFCLDAIDFIGEVVYCVNNKEHNPDHKMTSLEVFTNLVFVADSERWDSRELGASLEHAVVGREMVTNGGGGSELVET